MPQKRPASSPADRSCATFTRCHLLAVCYTNDHTCTRTLYIALVSLAFAAACYTNEHTCSICVSLSLTAAFCPFTTRTSWPDEGLPDGLDVSDVCSPGRKKKKNQVREEYA